MVKSSENGSASVAPFLKKCYDMVDDKSTDSIISWRQNNDSFVIWDTTEFSVRLLPKYFKHSNFSSFIRQLNIYGFKKIDTDQWAFANDGFIRDQKHLLKNISRRKHLQAPDQRNASQEQDSSVEPSEKVENSGLWKEVEDLKADKNVLMQEFVKLSQLQDTSENKLLLLKDRLQGMEKNQQQMLSFLIMAMQSPGFLAQLLQPKENNWRMAEAGNMIEQAREDGQRLASDRMIVRYQPPMDGLSEPVYSTVRDSENPPESDSASDGMKDFWMNVDFMKVLMDESHVPFAPPDLQDDGAWEKLFLDSPFLENIEDAKQDNDGVSNDSGMPAGGTESGSHLEKPIVYRSQLETSQHLELLTEQMGYLTSESNQIDGTR